MERSSFLTTASPNPRCSVLPAWSNLWLQAAITLSMSSTSSSSTSQPSLSSSLRVHSRLFLMLTSSLPSLFLFFVGPLSWPEWRAVLLFSFPVIIVIIVDEILKIFSRNMSGGASGIRWCVRCGVRRQVRDQY
ncbi:unnamed protein product [Closterium sp. NIES-65]|nr:unnamed protein product [Closterium sp. NIES-65]